MLPYATQYEELSLQFYCGQDLAELNFFQDWMDGIINPVSREASYYDDYAKHSKITILFVHNSLKSMEGIIKAFRNGNLSGIRFLEAYPRTMSINGGPLEWASKSSPLFVNITFGTREFVNIRTYDAELDKQLKRLEQSDLTNSIDDLLERSGEQNAAVNGTTMNKQKMTYEEEKQKLLQQPGVSSVYQVGGRTYIVQNGRIQPASSIE